MCSSGARRALGGQLQPRPPEPDALSLAPGTSSPRSSRSASIASAEGERRPIAARRGARPPRSRRSSGPRRKHERRDSAGSAGRARRRCTRRGVEHQAGAGRVHVPAQAHAPPRRSPRAGRCATTLTLGSRESRSDSGVRRRSPSSASAASAAERERVARRRRRARALQQPSGERRRRTARRTGAANVE